QPAHRGRVPRPDRPARRQRGPACRGRARAHPGRRPALSVRPGHDRVPERAAPRHPPPRTRDRPAGVAAGHEPVDPGGQRSGRRARAAQRERGRRERIALPALAYGGWTWADDPLVADLPDAARITGVALLPEGRWNALRRAYGLARASEVVRVDVLPVRWRAG